MSALQNGLQGKARVTRCFLGDVELSEPTAGEAGGSGCRRSGSAQHRGFGQAPARLPANKVPAAALTLLKEGGRGSGKATIDYCCPRPTTRTPSITHPSAWAITCFPHPRSDQGPHMLPALLDLSGERDAKDLSCSTPCRLMRFPTRQNRPALQTPLGGVFWPRAMCAIGQDDHLAALS